MPARSRHCMDERVFNDVTGEVFSGKAKISCDSKPGELPD